MLTAIKRGGNRNGELINSITQPPILWLRFFGWFISGLGFGWLMRALTSSANEGAMSTAMTIAVSIGICSQIGIVLFPLLRRDHIRPH